VHDPKTDLLMIEPGTDPSEIWLTGEFVGVGSCSRE